MPQRECNYCGNTFAVLRPEGSSAGEFCNVGCAVRARVPVDAEGNFPINQHLVTVLIVGFFWINQAMVAGLSGLLTNRGRAETSLKLAWISFGLGALIWLMMWLVQRREGIRRGKDFVVAGVTFGILLAAIWKTEPQVGLALAATMVLLVWNFRGLTFKQRLA